MNDLTPDDIKRIGEAIAYQNKLDYDETGPKAPHGDITYKGVALSSQYDVKSEFDEMKRVIDSMPELMARRINSIWCDSKACACFIVQIRRSSLWKTSLTESKMRSRIRSVATTA